MLKLNNFIKKFNNGDGFYGYTPYIKGTGFSIKKDLKGDSRGNTSLLKFYIPDDSKCTKERRPIIINVTYGEKSEEGITVLAKAKISDPINFSSRDEYYYDPNNNKLYKSKGEISPSELINGIYSDHIKPTKPTKGFWLRMKLVFWWIILAKFLSHISTFFHYFLYIISGDKYSYEPILKEEVLNNEIIDSMFKDMVGQKKGSRMKEHLKEGKKFNFLGYEASRWTILFYAILHLLIYLVFGYKNWQLGIVASIFRNNFLTLIYVISSLWFMEIVIPVIFKKIIKITSAWAWNSLKKNIKI